MKCEICHKADAKTVVKAKNADGMETDLFVCTHCAAEHKKTISGSVDKKPNAGKGRMNVLDLSSDQEAPPEFIKNFVEATLDFMKGVSSNHQKKERKCPHCGKTWEDIEKSTLLGCPKCWTHFAQQIQESLLSDQYGPVHIGEAPQFVDKMRSVEFLKRELAKAVKGEQYEKASELQHRIDALKGSHDETNA